MEVVVQGIKMNLKKKLNSEERKFLEDMKKQGFILTYYQGEDKNKGGSIDSFELSLKNRFTLKN